MLLIFYLIWLSDFEYLFDCLFDLAQHFDVFLFIYDNPISMVNRLDYSLYWKVWCNGIETSVFVIKS